MPAEFGWPVTVPMWHQWGVGLHAAKTRRLPALRLPHASKLTWTLVCLLVPYAALTVAVLTKSPVLKLDQWFYDLHLRQKYPWSYHPIHTYVIVAQRRPVTEMAFPLLLLFAWRARSPRPLVALVVATIALNLSVGFVKVGTGRIGPRYGHPTVDQIFAGGDIYPSGHVAGAVVSYGLLAMFAPLAWRRFTIWLAVFLSVTVGVGTII